MKKIFFIIIGVVAILSLQGCTLIDLYRILHDGIR